MKAKFLLSAFLVLSVSLLNAQTSNKRYGIPLIGSEAPTFTAESTNGVLNFPEDFGKKWKILFSHPKDFTPVCTHEILHLALLQDQFEDLDVEIAILSTDTKELHLLWKNSMEEILSKRAYPVKIKFPFIDDPKGKVAKLYGMIHEDLNSSKTVRGVFIINPDNVIEAVTFYPFTVGRSLKEMLRAVQALQTVEASKLFTPADWQPFNDLLVPKYPYTEKELIENPELLNDYYKIGSYLWYKKTREE